ncbi:hypothetical protein [Kinneretia aquatilis]|nr:hypothetical protein [Paucibacter aquatile]
MKLKSKLNPRTAWAVALCAAGLVACGGGGGGGGADTGSSTAATGSTGGSASTSLAGKVTVKVPKWPKASQSTWIAYQDGDGAWKVPEKVGDDYSFQVDSVDGRYAVIVAVDDRMEANPTVTALYMTRSEATELDLQSLDAWRSAKYEVRADIRNPTGGERCYLWISVYSGREACNSWQPDRHYFRVSDAPFDASLSRFDAEGVANMYVYLRDQKAASAMSLSLDMAQATPLVASQRIDLPAGDVRTGEALSYSISWRAAQGAVALNRSATSPAYAVLPANGNLPSGVYAAWASAVLKQGQTTSTRQAGYRSLSGLGQTVQLPASVSPIALSMLPGSSPIRPVLKWSPMAGSLASSVRADNYEDVNTRGVGPSLSWDFLFSSGWIRKQKTVEYTTPDLSGLGWNPNWSFRPGTQLTVSYSEDGDSAPEANWYSGAARIKNVESKGWSSRVETLVNLP